MNIKSFPTFKNLFGNPGDDEKDNLYRETLFMVLAGAANADLNIESSETDRIQSILREKLGHEVSTAEIKTKAELDLSSTSKVAKNVRVACMHLSTEQRQELLDSMLEVFRSDGSMGPLERDYFDEVVGALGLAPSEMLKL